jgi:hypothetical protein
LELNLLGLQEVTRRAVLALGAAALLLLAVAAVGVGVAVYQPARVDVRIAPPTNVVALRPGTWTFQVRDLGPSIGDFGLQLAGGDGWLAQHTVVSMSAPCQQTASAEILCGPVLQGETLTVAVQAKPNAGGNYSYKATFCDCSQGRPSDLLGPDSPRFSFPGSTPQRYVEAWGEQVQPEPTAAVSVTDLNGNALSGASVSIQGSSVFGVTAPTGVAQLGLGPLGPGIYTVVATDHPGYMNVGTQVTVPDLGDAAPVALRMLWAPPIGTFVFHSHSTLYQVMVVSLVDPNYTLSGYVIEWHCYYGNWTNSSVTVTLGQDQITWDNLNVPMAPGKISSSWVLNGPLPDTSQPAPAGTCVNGQNAW